MKRTVCLLLTVFLAGCSTLADWSKLKPGEYRDSARRFTAVVPEEWMRFNVVKYFFMTRDGIALDYIAVEILKFKDDLKNTKKKFTADMLPQELVEVEIDNYKSNPTVRNFNIIKNEPATIDGHPAFYLEYLYETSSGLPVHGVHVGFTENDRVYRVIYQAPEQHYFQRHRPAFEDFVKSFKLISRLRT